MHIIILIVKERILEHTYLRKSTTLIVTDFPVLSNTASYLKEMEHVATSLRYRCHLGDDGEVVNDKRNIVLLILSEVLSMTQ